MTTTTTPLRLLGVAIRDHPHYFAPVSSARTTHMTICLRCGSLTPTVPALGCSHPEAATFSDVRPELVDLLTRIRRIRSSMRGALDALQTLARLEARAGRARLETEPAAHLAGLENVQFLRPREVHVHEDGSVKRAPTPPALPNVSTLLPRYDRQTEQRHLSPAKSPPKPREP